MIHEGYALLCQIGFWGWMASAACLALMAFPARGVFRPGAALFWGTCLVVLYSAWIVGMLRA